MHFLAGILYLPIMLTYAYLGLVVIPNGHSHLSLILWTLSWIAQFIGHGIFEKRAPALLTNLPQSIHAAVFFVWLELLFEFGFHPALKKRLDSAIVHEKKKFMHRHLNVYIRKR